MLRKLLGLLSGNIFKSVMLFLRMIIAASLISVADIGISATFMVFVTLLQMVSNLGLGQMIIQNDRGDDPEFQKGLQGFQLIRGILNALILFLLAKPMALILENDDIVWAYQLLALMPLFASLTHFDTFRLQRAMRFGPLIAINTLPYLIGVLMLWPLDRLFNDYRIMLYSILAQGFMRMFISHIIAERPFRLSFDPALMRASFNFGWPLLLNGVMLFLVLQGEKLVVGRELGMASLGIFAMALTLVQTPTGSASQTINQFLMPQLSAVKDDNKRFDFMALVAVQASQLIGICLLVGIVLLGAPIVNLTLGSDYAQVVPLLLWVGVMQSVRSARACTSLVALARAKTGNGLAGNVPRVLSIPISWYALTQGYGMSTVLLIATIAEILGYLVGLLMMRRRAGTPLRPMIPSLLSYGMVLIGFALYGVLTQSQMAVQISPYWIALIPAVAIGVNVLLMRESWSYIRNRTR